VVGLRRRRRRHQIERTVAARGGCARARQGGCGMVAV
jgi:hypothetical protein